MMMALGRCAVPLINSGTLGITINKTREPSRLIMAEVCMKCFDLDWYIEARTPINNKIAPGITGIRALVLLLAMRYCPMNPVAMRSRPKIIDTLAMDETLQNKIY
jgi:hypothetical protein